MGVFDPDDFSGQPYVGGMNQALHFVFGAALLGQASYWTALSMFWCVLASGAGYVAWESYQLKRKGATKADYWADLAYWMSGTAACAFAIFYHMDPRPLVAMPLVVWVIEYTRLRVME